MIKHTTWTPDTCGCELVYSWDSTTSEQNRVHTPVSSKPCAIHGHLKDVPTHHTAIIKENQSKNQAIEEACQAVPRLLPEHFSFSFDANRNLTLAIATLSDVELAAVHARALPKMAGLTVTKQ